MANVSRDARLGRPGVGDDDLSAVVGDDAAELAPAAGPEVISIVAPTSVPAMPK